MMGQCGDLELFGGLADPERPDGGRWGEAGACARVNSVLAHTGSSGPTGTVKGLRMTPAPWQWAFGWLGLVALLATLVVYASSGLVTPAWAFGLLLIVWLALLAVAVRLLRTRRPLYVLLLPVVAWLIWIGVLTAGGHWLGWTA